MNIYRLIYKSKPFGYDQAILNGILSDAINYNSKNNITGALICREDIYLTFEKISKDDRHLEIELLLKEYCNKRIFPGWNMKDDPARTWFWNKDEINSGIFNKIPKIEIIEVFEKIANQIN